MFTTAEGAAATVDGPTASASSSSVSSAGARKQAHQAFPHNVICPVTLKPMNKKNPFVVMWDTGEVYSLKAVREMPEACTGSGGGIGAPASERAVALAPSDLEREKIRERMLNKGGSKKRKRGMQKRLRRSRQRRTEGRKPRAVLVVRPRSRARTNCSRRDTG